MLILLYLIILQIFFSYSIKALDVIVDNKIKECNDPLICYLNELVINIPDIHIEVNRKELDITQLYCNNINIDSIPSLYKEPTTLEIGTCFIDK